MTSSSSRHRCDDHQALSAPAHTSPQMVCTLDEKGQMCRWDLSSNTLGGVTQCQGFESGWAMWHHQKPGQQGELDEEVDGLVTIVTESGFGVWRLHRTEDNVRVKHAKKPAKRAGMSTTTEEEAPVVSFKISFGSDAIVTA